MTIAIYGDQAQRDVRLFSQSMEDGDGSPNLSGAGVSITAADIHGRLSLYGTMSSGSRISIGRNCVLGALSVHALAPGATIVIGAGLGVNGFVVRINHAADIIIGPRVWLAARVMVLKGVAIGADTVAAAGSIVTHDRPGNCIVAGIPAREVRRGVRWEQ